MSMKRHTKSDKGEPFVRNCNGEMIAGPPSVVHGTYGGSFKFCDSWRREKQNCPESAHKGRKKHWQSWQLTKQRIL